MNAGSRNQAAFQVGVAFLAGLLQAHASVVFYKGPSMAILGSTVTLVCQFDRMTSSGSRGWTTPDGSEINALTIDSQPEYRYEETLDQNITRLVIIAFQRAHVGDFTCQDQIGGSHTFKISLLPAPSVAVSPLLTIARRGDIVSLYCLIFESVPIKNMSITWVRNDSQSEVLSRSQNFTMQVTSKDSGFYECRVYIPAADTYVSSLVALVEVEDYLWGPAYIMLGIIVVLILVTPLVVLCLRSADLSVEVVNQEAVNSATGIPVVEVATTGGFGSKLQLWSNVQNQPRPLPQWGVASGPPASQGTATAQGSRGQLSQRPSHAKELFRGQLQEACSE